MAISRACARCWASSRTSDPVGPEWRRGAGDGDILRPSYVWRPPLDVGAPSHHIGVTMTGRVKRKAGLAAAAARAAQAAGTPVGCTLCERPLGHRIEFHHLVPRSEGGRATAAIHPICHRIIHATLTNAELARDFADPAVLRTHPAIARFRAWIADKPPDFSAPTRRAR